MAPIMSSIEISRPTEEVFSYVTDPSRLAEWQESVVSSHLEGAGPPAPGSKAITTRKIGRGERRMTMEMTDINPPDELGRARNRRADQGDREGHRRRARRRCSVAGDYRA